MQQARPIGQKLAGRSRPDERALARLAHSKIAGVQHAKAHLCKWRQIFQVAAATQGLLWTGTWKSDKCLQGWLGIRLMYSA